MYIHMYNNSINYILIHYVYTPYVAKAKYLNALQIHYTHLQYSSDVMLHMQIPYRYIR